MDADNRFASRKFLLTAFVTLCSVGFLLGGVITSDQWVDFTKWMLAIYFTGNVMTLVAANQKS